MKYTITVKPNAKRPKVEHISSNELIVCVDASPIEGKANRRTIELLAEHFRIAKSRITLCKGATGRRKIFEIQ